MTSHTVPTVPLSTLRYSTVLLLVVLRVSGKTDKRMKDPATTGCHVSFAVTVLVHKSAARRIGQPSLSLVPIAVDYRFGRQDIVFW